MAQTSREIVKRCLKFEYPERMPREIWALPWAEERFPAELKRLRERYPADFACAGDVGGPAARQKGTAYMLGDFTDEWGCVFTNIQKGVHGEIRNPQVKDLANWRTVRPPYATLPQDERAAREKISREYAATDKFFFANCCPRPWERYQFLRGSENSMLDMMDYGPEVKGLLRLIHEFYLKELEFHITTEVDAIGFMDDWGSQRQLLIPPAVWRAVFKPLYKTYCDLAHAHGKFVFMHSDGHIAEIYDDLLEIGVDAVNSQLFCMDMPALAAKAKGRLTFWGEIDRQHVMSAADPQVGRDAVRQVARHFYDPRGGIIAQFELGPGSNPEVAFAIFDEWEQVEREARSAPRRPAGGRRRSV